MIRFSYQITRDSDRLTDGGTINIQSVDQLKAALTAVENDLKSFFNIEEDNRINAELERHGIKIPQTDQTRKT